MVYVLTLFPEMFRSAFEEGLLRIARDRGLLRAVPINLRDFTEDRHRSVDDRPFGGGPGMVLMPGPVFRAMERVEAESPGTRRILLTPQGRPYTQSMAQEFAREPVLCLLCGHYEGFDERIRLGIAWEEVSLGDFVLSGGEIPALAVLDSVARLLPGALGHPKSAEEDSFAMGLLEYPQYTRPREFRGMRVPEVLLSGDHAAIAAWRKAQAEERTRARRPDLMRRPPEGA